MLARLVIWPAPCRPPRLSHSLRAGVITNLPRAWSLNASPGNSASSSPSRNVSDQTGGAAADDLETLRDSVKLAIVGWKHPDADRAAIFVRGNLISFDNATLWWLDRYQNPKPLPKDLRRQPCQHGQPEHSRRARTESRSSSKGRRSRIRTATGARDADGNELRRHQWAKDEAEARERAAAEEDATPNSSTGKPAPAPADGPAAEAKE